MTRGAQILLGTAILCLVLWFGLMALGVQPLTTVSPVDVVYGEGEDFYSDAIVYRKLRNSRFLLVQLPHARPAYRWISIDYGSTTMSFAAPARRLGSLTYRVKNDDLQAVRIGSQNTEKEWYWHFTEQGAAVSGNGFSFRIKHVPR